MNIKFYLYISPIKESTNTYLMMKSFESPIRPMVGDIIDDPGFDSQFHNSYEVVKVTLNYANDECFVSLNPLVIELQEIAVEAYIDKLKANGWKEISKEHI